MTQVGEILLKGTVFLVTATVVISAALFAVGETVKHLTPEKCPPFYQCTPKGDWNHPNCKCWDSK